MSIYEYNEEYVRKSLTETGYEQGLADGRKEGISETLVKNVDAVMQNLKLDLEKACKAIGITKEDYINARSKL